MARPLRIEYPGAIYHVISRGDRREAIFRTEADRKLFLDLLDQTCRRTGWQIHAYCLMDNHFHLVVETPRGNLSTGMQWLTRQPSQIHAGLRCVGNSSGNEANCPPPLDRIADSALAHPAMKLDVKID